MPYTTYTHMTMQDVRDLMAYLRTLPAVSGRPPDHELVFPFNIRSAVRVWKALYFARGPLPVVTTNDAKWQRGRYLVEAVTHCAECHSTRGWMGSIKPETRFAGGPNPEGIGFAPNITPARLGSWTQADLVRLLTDGRTPSGRVAGGSMADVVTNTATLPLADREAIAAYIATLPPRPTPEP
jgi:mono/diheme cytochrome c family protein